MQKWKMTGKGGSGRGFRIFPELRKVLGCHMPNFRSLGQSLHIDDFCKNEGGGGGLLSFCPKKPNLLSLVIKKLLLYKGKNWKIPTTQLSINTNYGELFDWTTGGHVVVRHFCAYSETHEQESRQTGNYIFDHN